MPLPSADIDKKSPDEEDASLSQSASYTDLSALSASADSSAPPPLRRAFSEHQVHGHTDNVRAKGSGASLGKGVLRRKSYRSKGKPSPEAIGASQLNLSTEDLVNGSWNAGRPPQAGGVGIPETKPPEPVARPAKGRFMPGRLVNMTWKPWSSSSQTRSPTSLQSGKTPRELLPPLQVDSAASQPAVDDKQNVSYGRPRLPKLAVVADGGVSPVTPTSPARSLRSKRSFSKLSSAPNVSTPVLPPASNGTPTSSIGGSDRPEVPRMKDKLWGVFRNLDVEYQK